MQPQPPLSLQEALEALRQPLDMPPGFSSSAGQDFEGGSSHAHAASSTRSLLDTGAERVIDSNGSPAKSANCGRSSRSGSVPTSKVSPGRQPAAQNTAGFGSGQGAGTDPTAPAHVTSLAWVVFSSGSASRSQAQTPNTAVEPGAEGGISSSTGIGSGSDGSCCLLVGLSDGWLQLHDASGGLLMRQQVHTSAIRSIRTCVWKMGKSGTHVSFHSLGGEELRQLGCSQADLLESCFAG